MSWNELSEMAAKGSAAYRKVRTERDVMHLALRDVLDWLNDGAPVGWQSDIKVTVALALRGVRSNDTKEAQDA